MSIEALTKKYNLVIESTFSLELDSRTVKFDALIIGYGAKNGMIIDMDGSKLMEHSSKITELNFGFSSFNIYSSDICEGFQEVLDDWGINGI